MGVDCAGITEIVIIPYAVEDFFPRQGNSLIFHKIRQQFKLFKAQINACTVDCDDMRCLVDGYSAIFEDFALCELIGAAQYGFHSRHQDFWTERLRDILIYSQLKTLKLVSFICSSCQHDDGNF